MTEDECEIETSKAIMEMRSRIAELEKENAELLKAREIVKNLIDSFILIDGEQVRELKTVKEAEQLFNIKIE